MTVGEQLKQARTQRKLALGDVSRDTKIQPWVLQALEADELQHQMSPIYVKGFLATYAKFLRVEPEPLLASLRWPKAEPEPVQVPPPAPPVTRSLPAVRFALPRLPRWPRLPQISLPQVSLPRLRVPRVPRIPLSLLRRAGTAVAVSAAIAGLIALNPLKYVRPKTVSAKATPAKASPATASPKKLASVAKIQEPMPAISSSALPTLTLMATQPLELQMTARSTTWIQVRADGKLLTEQRLARGTNERWTAKKRFELFISKPSQVDLTLNGQPIGPFAIAHQGRLLITHRGVTQLPDREP